MGDLEATKLGSSQGNPSCMYSSGKYEEGEGKIQVCNDQQGPGKQEKYH